jgi:hypothetical protein
MKTKFFAVAALLLSVVSGRADASNVTYGADVTISDPQHELGSVGDWGGTGVLAASSTITSGSFLPQHSQWDIGTIFWSSDSRPSQLTITVDLNGLFNLTDITLQADNNDDYRVSYLDASDAWHSLGLISPPDYWGLDLAHLNDLQGVVAKKLAINGANGDGHYALSRIVAEGTAVPLPAALPLFGIGVAGLAGLSRRRV